jgi:hypothetical protein
MRLIRSLTRSMCVIESQISRVETPAEVGYVDGQVRNLASSFAVYREPEVDTQLSPVAAMPGVVSLIPNRAAVVEIALAAGFASADVLEPPTDSDPDRRREDRVVVLARC